MTYLHLSCDVCGHEWMHQLLPVEYDDTEYCSQCMDWVPVTNDSLCKGSET